MRLLVTCCINLIMWVNSLRDSQCESILFFFPIFYDVLILFTSAFFIVVSALEEVGPWKMDVYIFFWMTFMVPVGFGLDLSFSLNLTCQRNCKNEGTQLFFLIPILYPSTHTHAHIRMHKDTNVWTFLSSAIYHKAHQISVCAFMAVTREWVITTLWLLRDFKYFKFSALPYRYWKLASHSHYSPCHFSL